MKSIKTILSHDKNVAKFLSSEFSVCIRDCQLVKHGLATYKLHSELASLALHAFAPCKTWTASYKPIRNSLRSLLMCLRIKTKKSAYKLACSRFFCLNPCFTNHPQLRCSLRKRWSVLRRSPFLPYWHRHTGIPTSCSQVLSHSSGKGFRSLGSYSVNFPDT